MRRARPECAVLKQDSTIAAGETTCAAASIRSTSGGLPRSWAGVTPPATAIDGPPCRGRNGSTASTVPSSRKYMCQPVTAWRCGASPVMNVVTAAAVVEGKIVVMLARRCGASAPPDAASRARWRAPRPSITNTQTLRWPAISSGRSAPSGSSWLRTPNPATTEAIRLTMLPPA